MGHENFRICIGLWTKAHNQIPTPPTPRLEGDHGGHRARWLWLRKGAGAKQAAKSYTPPNAARGVHAPHPRHHICWPILSF
jgi:hypothetical protein